MLGEMLPTLGKQDKWWYGCPSVVSQLCSRSGDKQGTIRLLSCFRIADKTADMSRKRAFLFLANHGSRYATQGKGRVPTPV
jgi:hypothetical protein